LNPEIGETPRQFSQEILPVNLSALETSLRWYDDLNRQISSCTFFDADYIPISAGNWRTVAMVTNVFNGYVELTRKKGQLDLPSKYWRSPEWHCRVTAIN
jgi:hypothetical protein